MEAIDCEELHRSCLRTVLLLLAASRRAWESELLLEEIRSLGLHDADAASVYRALKTLEQEGLVQSGWEPHGRGPSRRTYTIAAAGPSALDDGIKELALTKLAMDRMLASYSNLDRPR